MTQIEPLELHRRLCLAARTMWGIDANEAKTIIIAPTDSNTSIIPYISTSLEWHDDLYPPRADFRQVRIELQHFVTTEWDMYIGHAEIEGKHVIAYKREAQGHIDA